MELRHLRYFVAVAEELHFGRAALRLSISQPPLSMQISNLEQELGLKLFNRLGRSIELTAAGHEFLEHARNLLGQISFAVRSTQRVSRGEIGELAIGFSSPIAYSYLPWLLRAYRKRFPDINLVLHELTIAQQLHALLDGRLQVGLMRPPVESPDLTSEIVSKESYIVALPDQHLLTLKKEITVNDLRDEFFIMFPRGIGGRFYSQVLTMCLDAGFSPKVSQEVTQMHTIIGLVSAGLGIAVVPESIQALQLGGVVYRPLSSPSPYSEIAMAWRRDDQFPATRMLLDLVRELAPQGWNLLRHSN